jgi:hypothetical protein
MLNKLLQIWHEKKNLIITSILFFLFLVSLIFVLQKNNNKNKLIDDLRNRVASLNETIEISEGVFYAMAQEETKIKRSLDEILSENDVLRKELEDANDRIAALLSVEAILTDDINFDSQNGGSVRVSIRERENEIAATPQTGQEAIPIDSTMDNVVVEFDLTAQGFRVFGQTESNPPRASLDLEQIEPFVVDLALTQSSNGWSVFMSEQQNRLNLNVGTFVVDPMITKERWYQRFGMGIAVSSGTSTIFGAGPAFSFETRSNLDIGISATYNIDREMQGQLSLTFRPFKKQ